MTLITLHEAEIEFYESINHYESKEAGLVFVFVMKLRLW